MTQRPDPSAELSSLRQTVNELHRMVDARLSDDPVREKAFDKLYEELRHYRDDFVGQAEKPLLLDLLLLYDSFHWFQATLIREESSQEVVADAFQYLVDELLEILYRRDVVPLETADRFDRTTQRAVQTQPAPSPADDARIAQVLKRGFRRGEAVLRPEEVVVFRHKTGGGGGA